MTFGTPTADKIFNQHSSIEFGVTKQKDNATAAFLSMCRLTQYVQAMLVRI